jgi:hypothetical protein
MSHKVLLVSLLVVSFAAFAQTGAVNQPSTPGQVSISPNQPVPIGNGLGTAGGTVGYYGEGPIGGVLLTTPTATFDSPAPTAGISNAGRAGISNSSPANVVVESTLNPSTLVYSNVQPEIVAPASPATAAVGPERQVNDLGPSYFSNELGGAVSNGPNLGEVAAYYKNLPPPRNLRTYTNADIRPPANFSNGGNSVLAANMPPALPQSGAASTRTSATTQNPIQSGGNTERSESQGSNQNQQLPASASILPLLALFGLMSTGLGLVVRGVGRRS